MNDKINCVLLSPMKSGTMWMSSLMAKHREIRLELFKKSNINQLNEGLPIFPKMDKLLVLRRNLNPKFQLEQTFYTHNSEMKFIVLLRSPIERLRSHIHHLIYKMGPSSSAITNFINRESYGNTFVFDFNSVVENFRNNEESSPIIAKGLYAQLLTPYLDKFGNDQFLFLSSEKAFAEPRLTLSKIFNFLELSDPTYIKDSRFLYKKINGQKSLNSFRGRLMGQKRIILKPFNNESKNYLNAIFEKENDELFKIVGPDLL